MSAPKLESVKTRLENVIALARLLERVERSTVAPIPTSTAPSFAGSANRSSPICPKPR